MFKRSLTTAAMIAVSLSGVLVLSACEEHPYPSASQPNEQPAPPPPPAPLAGAPAYAPPPPPAPAPAETAPAPRNDAGSVVAMAPIPNPGDPGSEAYYSGGHAIKGGRVHTRLYAPSQSPAQAYPADNQAAATASPKARAAAPLAVLPAKPAAPPKPSRAAPPAVIVAHSATTPPPVVAGAGPTAAVAPKPALTPVKPVAAPPSQASSGAAPPAPADHAAQLTNLQTALSDVVSKNAVLTTPDHFVTGQPTDVTLTLPKRFADAMHTEANKDGLGDDAASVNMNAVLSGAGFTVTPEAAQAQPLTAGQDNIFRWTVTAQPGAKGPLHADVGATLLGEGSDPLALGSVQKSAGAGVKMSGRFVGASILVLIAALVVAWLARGRGDANRPTSIRTASEPRSSPFDIGPGPGA